jgi:GTP pyrophosphokinase
MRSEDCGVTKPQADRALRRRGGELVDGLTKLDKLQFNTREESQAESFRKMLLAMARDVRVILVKLADRTHNMRTLEDVPREKWHRIASETLDIYAPIAHRLGLNNTYRELQELSFRYLRPWRYAVLAKAVSRARSRRRDLIQKVHRDVENAFDAGGIEGAHRRAREDAVLHLQEDGREAPELRAGHGHLRLPHHRADGHRTATRRWACCTSCTSRCPGRFKDHIAIPKINGYQSLHTTLVGPFGVNVEFQLRTEAMHLVAESGVAAHWLYKASVPQEDGMERLGTKWLQSLLDIQNETRDAAEFWDHVKIDLFPDAVYVFTPKSQILALPRGATVGRFRLRDPLRRRRPHGGRPHQRRAGAAAHRAEERRRGRSRDGAGVGAEPGVAGVRAHRARPLQDPPPPEDTGAGRIAATGREAAGAALRAEGVDKLPPGRRRPPRDLGQAAALHRQQEPRRTAHRPGPGQAHRRHRRQAPDDAAGGTGAEAGRTADQPGALHGPREPLAGRADAGRQRERLGAVRELLPAGARRPILGYLGRGEGLVVHTTDCAVAKRLQHKDSERFIGVEWAEEPVRSFETGILVTVANGKGALARVAAALANAEADITHVDMDDERAQDATDLRFVVSVRDRSHLESVLRNLKRTPSVMNAQRIRPGGTDPRTI